MKKLIFLFIIILALPLVFQSTPTEVLKLKIYDALVSKQDPSGYFTILNITEDDIDREGGYPIPRQRLGEIHREIMNRGALGVGWVISFPHPDRFGGDKYFADSLQQGTTILAMFEAPNQKYPKTIGTVIQGPDIGGMVSKGVVQNTNNLRKNVAQGISAAPPDRDNLVRRMPLLLRTPDGYVSSFGTEVLKTLVGAKTYIIKINDNDQEKILRVIHLENIKSNELNNSFINASSVNKTLAIRFKQSLFFLKNSLDLFLRGDFRFSINRFSKTKEFFICSKISHIIILGFFKN